MFDNIKIIVNKARASKSSIFDLATTLIYEVSSRIAKRFQPWRDWDLCFGPVFGEAGTIQTINMQPQVLFRGEKIIATDTASLAGMGTRIMQILVGQKMQRPNTGGGSLSLFFGPGALGNGLAWDECPPALTIAVTVSFIENCTFDMTVFGKAKI